METPPSCYILIRACRPGRMSFPATSCSLPGHNDRFAAFDTSQVRCCKGNLTGGCSPLWSLSDSNRLNTLRTCKMMIVVIKNGRGGKGGGGVKAKKSESARSEERVWS